MSTCSNCYNGCAETISDQCVKYTGINVPALGISTGDNLLAVENAIVNFLVPAINGTGIKPIIDPNIICDLVKGYLPACTTCTGFTLNEILTAIVKTVCDLQDQIDAIDVTLATLNANYTIGCLTGVTASSDTHDIVQAVITNLCSLNSAFSILVTQLAATNVTIFNVDSYIANYLATQTSANLASARMVPYCPIAYYGPLSGYPTVSDSLSLTGPGVGYWKKIYLCNGANPGVPDLRGRVIVGTTVMGNNAFPSQTDPCGSCTTCANPLYALGTVAGSNCVTLTVPQLPNHTHLNTATANTILTPDKHNHGWTGINGTGNPDGSADSTTAGSPGSYARQTQELDVTITAATTVNVTIAATGSGDSHPNIQPVIALHYIMYIP